MTPHTQLLLSEGDETPYVVLTRFLVDAELDDLIAGAPVLCRFIPALEETVNFNQHSPHHAYDVYTHICHVTAAVPREATLRWAALLHDVGKPACFAQDETGRGHFKGHAQVGAAMAAPTWACPLKCPRPVSSWAKQAGFPTSWSSAAHRSVASLGTAAVTWQMWVYTS